MSPMIFSPPKFWLIYFNNSPFTTYIRSIFKSNALIIFSKCILVEQRLRVHQHSFRSANQKYPSTCYVEPPQVGNRDKANVNMWTFKFKKFKNIVLGRIPRLWHWDTMRLYLYTRPGFYCARSDCFKLNRLPNLLLTDFLVVISFRQMRLFGERTPKLQMIVEQY